MFSTLLRCFVVVVVVFFYPHTVVFTKWGEGQRRAAALGPPTGRLESREEPGAPAKGRSV